MGGVNIFVNRKKKGRNRTLPETNGLRQYTHKMDIKIHKPVSTEYERRGHGGEGG